MNSDCTSEEQKETLTDQNVNEKSFHLKRLVLFLINFYRDYHLVAIY